MTDGSLLDGKKILAVDDEPDILEALEELLSMCELTKASTFDEAKDLLESMDFDIAILDIMGVDGYALLDIANRRNMQNRFVFSKFLLVCDSAVAQSSWTLLRMVGDNRGNHKVGS